MRQLRPMIVAALVVGAILGLVIWTYGWVFVLPLFVAELVLICAVITWSIRHAVRGDRAAAGCGVVTAIAMLGVTIGLGVFLHQRWIAPPAQLERQALVGQTEKQIIQRLGRPYYDSRIERGDGTGELCLSYTYGLGGYCSIRFDEAGVAVDVSYSSK